MSENIAPIILSTYVEQSGPEVHAPYLQLTKVGESLLVTVRSQAPRGAQAGGIPYIIASIQVPLADAMTILQQAVSGLTE